MTIDRKICVVAGAGPGIGLATARRFSRGGYHVVLLARNEKSLAAMAGDIRAVGGEASTYAVDLSDIGETKQTFAGIERDYGAASVLIYNAARWREMDPLTVDPQLFRADLDLAVTGALVALQHVAPGMRKSGAGTILVTGGGLALYPEAGSTVASLTAAKAALRAFTLAAAKPLAEQGIHLATVTVAGMVRPGTDFDPDLIAERFWEMHMQPSEAWSAETIFKGATP